MSWYPMCFLIEITVFIKQVSKIYAKFRYQTHFHVLNFCLIFHFWFGWLKWVLTLILFFTNKNCLDLRNECLFLLAYLIGLCLIYRLQNSFRFSKLDMIYRTSLLYWNFRTAASHKACLYISISLLLIFHLYLRQGF